MTVTLELTPEVAARVETAQAQGININSVLERALPTPSGQAYFLREEAKRQTPRPNREQLRQALATIAQLGQGRPPLPPEAFDRENLYEDRN